MRTQRGSHLLSQARPGLCTRERARRLAFSSRPFLILRRSRTLIPSLGELRDRIAAILIETEDVFYGLSEFAGKIEHNPQRLEEVLARLEEISRLKRKHGDSIEEIIKKAATRSNPSLKALRIRPGCLRKSSGEGDSLREKVSAMPPLQYRPRRKAGARTASGIFFPSRPSPWGLKTPVSKWNFQEKELSGDGRDSVQFLFSANPGQAPRPVNRVASGGELSRIMLLLKSFVSTGDVRLDLHIRRSGCRDRGSCGREHREENKGSLGSRAR